MKNIFFKSNRAAITKEEGSTGQELPGWNHYSGISLKWTKKAMFRIFYFACTKEGVFSVEIKEIVQEILETKIHAVSIFFVKNIFIDLRRVECGTNVF